MLAVLAAWPTGLGAAAAHAQPVCDVEEAQRRFGEQPRPTTEIERLLAGCQGDAVDYRVYMFLGVMARDAGNQARAIELLRKAHQRAPEETNPALELALTLENRDPAEAAKVYDAVLARDPDSKPALLGLARIARSRNHLTDAREIYERLLRSNPNDPDALNGLAWLSLAERHRDEGEAGFERVLALDPTNEEAKIGLSKARDVYRYTLDTNGLFVTTDQGTSWGFEARAQIGVSAFDTIELGETHYTDELATTSPIGVAVLPSHDATIGYHRLEPLSYSVSLVYDFRDHSDLPDEHWIAGGATLYITDWLRGFGGYRQSFGAHQWEGRLVRAGLSVDFASSWEATATGYNSSQEIFRDGKDLWSGVFDLAYHGPHDMLVVAGAGYSPLIDNLDLHARTILPVADHIAVQLVTVHNTINDDTRVTAGFRFNW